MHLLRLIVLLLLPLLALNAAAQTPILKQLFYRLQDGGALQLTPPEKAELLTLYQKAYPAFYGREMADAAARSSWRVAAQRGLRAVGYVVMGILIVFILWGIFG